jgi:glycosyltransferase involved in cell wall biosynthesis
MSSKAIAILHPSSELYGADRIMVNVLKTFPKEVRKVVFLPCKGPLVDLINFEVENADVVIIDSMPIIYRAIFTAKGIIETFKKGFKFYKEIKKYDKLYDFDLCYVNTLSSSFMLPIISFLRIKSLIHVHEIIEKPYIIGSVTACMSELFSNRIVCVSKAVKTNLQSYFWSNFNSKCIVIHNGIATLTKEEKSHELSDICNVFLFGRIHPNKGHWFLVESIKHIKPEVLMKCKFTFMGGVVSGQESVKKSLEELITSFGLNDFIQIVDFQSDISEAMEEADICLVPSMFRDPFPTTVLESMSAGKPVIATEGGGAKEAVVHGETGYLVARGDVNSLSNYLTSLITDKNLRSKMGIAGRKRQKEFFDTNTFVSNWKNLIRNNNFLTPGNS